MSIFHHRPQDTQPWEDKLLLYPHEIKWKSNIPVPEKAEPERLDIPEAEPLRLECEHFLHSFINGNRPKTDGEEGLRVLKILNAAQRALDNNGCLTTLNASHAKLNTRLLEKALNAFNTNL